MAQHLLLAAFCVLIAVQFISSVEGESTCRIRCANRCRSQRRNHDIKRYFKTNAMTCLKHCQRLPKSCVSCNRVEKTCLKCLPGYKLINSRCIACETGCRCDARNKCLSCLPGYIMNADGICTACPAGCECDSKAHCIGCVSGYTDGIGPTDPPCVACNIANCANCSYSGPTRCDICKPGFLSVPVDGVCKACGSNCAICDKAGAGGCDTCNDGYKLSSGTCTACLIANCKNCDYAGTSYCDTCKDGYGLSKDHKLCFACALHCKSCHVQGYNKCDPAQCGTYSPISGYADKKCSGLDDCTGSNSGGSGICEVCYNSAATCDSCMAGNFKIDGICYDGCPDSTAGGTGANCLFCTSTTSCVKCDDSYTGTACTAVSTGSCTLSAGCKHCASPTECGDCSKGYKFNSADKTCTPCGVPNCDVCETSTTKCDKCAPGYNLFNSGTICKSACDARCGTPDCSPTGTPKSLCDTYCVDGYAIDKTADPIVCAPCAPGCRSCLIEGPGNCDDQQCEDGYKLGSDNKCA